MSDGNRRAFMHGWVDATQKRRLDTQYVAEEHEAAYRRGYAHGVNDRERALQEAAREGPCKTG
jgi:hypothetical protein